MFGIHRNTFCHVMETPCAHFPEQLVFMDNCLQFQCLCTPWMQYQSEISRFPNSLIDTQLDSCQMHVSKWSVSGFLSAFGNIAPIIRTCTCSRTDLRHFKRSTCGEFLPAAVSLLSEIRCCIVTGPEAFLCRSSRENAEGKRLRVGVGAVLTNEKSI